MIRRGRGVRKRRAATQPSPPPPSRPAARIVPPAEVISHGPPGTSVTFRDESLDAVRAHVDGVRAWLHSVIAPVAASTGATFALHLFVSPTTAPAADVAATIAEAADACGAAIVVVSKSNKTLLDRAFLGSVAGCVQGGARSVLTVVRPAGGAAAS